MKTSRLLSRITIYLVQGQNIHFTDTGTISLLCLFVSYIHLADTLSWEWSKSSVSGSPLLHAIGRTEDFEATRMITIIYRPCKFFYVHWRLNPTHTWPLSN